MQDRLREIEGTLARTKERKNTILYKNAKKKAEEERLARLGLKKLPTNPLDVDNIEVIKFVLFKQSQDIGDKIAKIRDPNLVSIEKDGEAAVRAKNDEINKLLATKKQWERRQATLSGQQWNPSPSKKVFFGCAKGLPEASKSSSRKRQRSGQEASKGDTNEAEDDDNAVFVDEDGSENDAALRQRYLDEVPSLFSGETSEILAKIERGYEVAHRESGASPQPHHTARLAPENSEEYVTSFLRNGVLTLPDEKDYERDILEKRKLALKSRLEAMRSKVEKKAE